MADLKLQVEVVEILVLEGLCPKCWNPSMLQIAMAMTMPVEILVLDVETGCVDCDMPAS